MPSSYRKSKPFALILIIAVSLSIQAQTLNSASDFIIGPQSPIGTTWFDQTEVDRARFHGGQCPVTAPTDADALNSFVLLNYYDLPLTEYIAYKRTGDVTFLNYARKCADAWWTHPQWIQSGAQRDFDNGQGPPPRHAGIGGLILRAMDGRPEMWDWITAYTRNQFNAWVGLRLNNAQLYYGVREGAFMLHYAIWIAATHPDATVRAEFLAKAETAVTTYFGRLQQTDGSWRWDDPDFVDPDGGQLRGVEQPFMVGLLLNALIDVHRLTSNTAVKTSIQTQLTKACLSLFNGPYRKSDPTGIAGVNWRSFWYFYYGGTTVNPTKYAKGGGSYVNADITTRGNWVIGSERQSASTIFSAYGYAYLLTGDPQYKAMGDELFDAAFGGSDGFRGLASDTAKNYNQVYRMGGRYLVWRAGSSGTTPTPTPSPTPPPLPSPSPSPSATPTPMPTRVIYESAAFSFSNETQYAAAIKTAASQGYESCSVGPSGKTLYCLRVKQ